MMLGPYPRAPERINGGVAAAMTYLCQALVRQPALDLIGVRVAKEDSSSTDDKQFAWPIVSLPLDRLSVSTLYWRQKRRFRTLIERYRPDIVHAQGADVSGFLAVGSEVPTVVTVHGLLGECAKLNSNPGARARDRIQGLLTERHTVRRAADIIAISPYVADYYAQEITGRVHAVPNAVAPSFFNVRRMRQRGRILFAGRISKGKGVVDLIRAAADARTAVEKIVLAGATPDLAYEIELRAEVRELGLAERVEFAGLLDESSLLEEFARAEALVLPSYQETAPMVVQQAMAAGLAVVATNVGGVGFQITHDLTGLLFEPGNIGLLASHLRRLGDDPSLGERLGAAAKNVAVGSYEARTVAGATRTVYETILNR